MIPAIPHGILTALVGVVIAMALHVLTRLDFPATLLGINAGLLLGSASRRLRP